MYVILDIGYCWILDFYLSFADDSSMHIFFGWGRGFATTEHALIVAKNMSRT